MAMTETDILAFRIAAGRADTDAFWMAFGAQPDMTCEEALAKAWEYSDEYSMAVAQLAAGINDFTEALTGAFSPALNLMIENLNALSGAYLSVLPWYRRWWLKMRWHVR